MLDELDGFAVIAVDPGFDANQQRLHSIPLTGPVQKQRIRRDIDAGVEMVAAGDGEVVAAITRPVLFRLEEAFVNLGLDIQLDFLARHVADGAEYLGGIEGRNAGLCVQHALTAETPIVRMAVDLHGRRGQTVQMGGGRGRPVAGGRVDAPRHGRCWRLGG